MTGLLFALLALQVIPGPTGTATGVVRPSTGLPVAGIRVVAIPAGDPNSISVNATVFESLAQTDASGRYTLVVPPGRYFIAAGSVSSPTYYPDTTDFASAKAIVISAGTTTDNINFSKYVTAAQGQLNASRVNISSAVLSGTIRFPDGSPASGIPVVAAPPAMISSPSAISIAAGFGPLLNTPIQGFQVSGMAATSTDAMGHFRIQNISPDTYAILAGYSDMPGFYPSSNDSRTPGTLVTTLTSTFDKLDFTILAPSLKQITLRGSVSGIDGRPVGAATVSVTAVDPPASMLGNLLPHRSYKTVLSEGDGTYKVDGIVPGTYSVTARIYGIRPNSQNIVIGDSPGNVDFAFPVNVISGRILWDDGSPFSESTPTQVALATTSNPNALQTTLVAITHGGAFSTVIEADDYRFFVPDLPNDYEIRSIRSGVVDLAREHLTFKGDAPADIEIRVARRSGIGPKVTGRAFDAMTGRAPSAERVQLCCLKSGPVERFSTTMEPDGSFEFSNVPEGQYTIDLSGKAPPRAINSQVIVGPEGLSNVEVVTSKKFVFEQVNLVVDNGSLPAGVSVPVTLTAVQRGFQVTTRASNAGMVWMIPGDIEYHVTASDIPTGFRLKSIMNGDQNLVATTDPKTGAPVLSFVSIGSSSVVVHLVQME